MEIAIPIALHQQAILAARPKKSIQTCAGNQIRSAQCKLRSEPE